MGKKRDIASRKHDLKKSQKRGKKRDIASRKHDLKKSHQGTIFLTAKALSLVKQMAKKTSLSKSVLVEQIVTGSMAIASSHADTTIKLNHTQESSTDGEQTNIEIIAGNQTIFKEELENVQKELAEAKYDSEQQRETYESLNKKLQEELLINETLQQQLLQNQALANQRAASNVSLQQKLQDQANQIQKLEQRVAELQSIATIAESQLNKWRKF